MTLALHAWQFAAGGTHGSSELELYTSEAVAVKDGVLTLTTSWNPTDCVPANGSAKTPGITSSRRRWCPFNLPTPSPL